ncbi:hypothetical protein Salat_1462200 [Sesamum alatum]|uniref:Uncharacterized protein n=1 Tax=Sesamum alatum TaxID=300844 RepID=A0AAE2CM34_9LAMI|nr:hypothetical protein Salat_1462200 [Sesamum alatum]
MRRWMNKQTKKVRLSILGWGNADAGCSVSTVSTCEKTCSKALMMVTGVLDGKETNALAGTRATHNFVSDRIVQELGLDVKPCDSQVKAVISKAVPISEVANMELGVGPWEGQCDLLAVGLDDFNVILGNDFFIYAKVTILPWLNGIFISSGSHPTFVRGKYSKGDTRT